MEDLLKRAQKLLDKGNVRYSDRNFEEERVKLAQDIADYLAKPNEVNRLREMAEQHGQCSYCEMDIAVEGHAADCTRPPGPFDDEEEEKPKKRVYLPVLKGDV